MSKNPAHVQLPLVTIKLACPIEAEFSGRGRGDCVISTSVIVPT